jgi:hypothetical protein
MLNTPIAFIVFNRPDTTLKVFEAIKKIKPRKLYVIADGPRESVPRERERCQATRAILDSIDWDCQVFKNYSEQNMGCGVRVSSGLSWAFENEDRLIILEDDTVPSEAFFFYCEELLEKYLFDTRIFTICGSNFFTERGLDDDSYLFSQYGNPWGWATWKRVWQHYDYSMKKWPLFRDKGLMASVFKTVEESRRFTPMFDEFYQAPKNIWTIQGAFMIWSNGALSIIPAKNLVTNIGNVGDHTSETGFFHFHKVGNNFRIEKHPDFIFANRYYDEYIFQKQWKLKKGISKIIDRIIKKFKRTILKRK